MRKKLSLPVYCLICALLFLIPSMQSKEIRNTKINNNLASKSKITVKAEVTASNQKYIKNYEKGM